MDKHYFKNTLSFAEMNNLKEERIFRYPESPRVYEKGNHGEKERKKKRFV
jgi:hypothetical protein